MIDGFHFERDLKRIAGNFQGRNIRQRIHKALEKEERKKVERILQEMMEQSEDEKTLERGKEFGAYVFNHWDEVVTRKKGDLPGSCTEGQVSHLLSKRFSRDPMGWSEKGLGKLSAARIYVKNGGKLSYKDFEKEDGKKGTRKYRDYAEQMINEMVENSLNWSIFGQTEVGAFDLASGTQRTLSQIGRSRTLLS